ncbi:MAG TPA: hypothetical protein VD994_06590 [Prosthecobacter sp.]|nr:hypothetical protein [Prosthecobacter sp.]
MKTYFAGIRRWCAVMAFVVPLLFWLAFLMLALGARYWSVIPWVLGLIAAVSFPPGLLGKSTGRSSTEPGYFRWLSLPGTILLYIWLSQQPEMHSLYHRILSGHALRHWLLITASLILLGTAIYRRRHAVRNLSDQDIYDFFKTGADAAPSA